MIKIGTITFHCSYNYGSALQTYALKTFLEKNMTYSVSVINFVYEIDFCQYRLFRIRKYLKHPWYFLLDIYFFKENKRRKQSFEMFAERYFNLTDKRYYNSNDMKELNQKFDVFICGSDQIWNLDCTQGVEPAYFLKFADKNKLKIAYAPSLAHVKFAKNYDEDLKEAIKDIDYISVREKSTLPLIQSLTEKKIEVVLDPTLLLDAEDYNSIVGKQSINEKYIFVYMLEYNASLVNYCNDFAKKHNIKVVYIANKKFSGLKGENAFGVGPDMFLEYIKNAEYVVTNSFHATVFSIIFNKKFITFTTKKSSSRMVDLLNNLGIPERIYKTGFDISKEIDYKKVKINLNKMRKGSLEYLNKALNRG